MNTDLHGFKGYILVLLGLTIDVPLTVRHIFEDNHNWAGFRLAAKYSLREVEITKVIIAQQYYYLITALNTWLSEVNWMEDMRSY